MPKKNPVIKADFRNREAFLFVPRVIEEVIEITFIFYDIYDNGVFGDILDNSGLGLVTFYSGKKSLSIPDDTQPIEAGR